MFICSWKHALLCDLATDSHPGKIDLTNGDMLVDDEEDVPITEQLKTPPPPPPPPPPAPEVIEIVEDEEEVEETVIESTESDEEMVIEDIVVEDDFDDIDVPFAVIEDVPIFPETLSDPVNKPPSSSTAALACVGDEYIDINNSKNKIFFIYSFLKHFAANLLFNINYNLKYI